mgnify:CR=1 FL=1
MITILIFALSSIIMLIGAHNLRISTAKKLVLVLVGIGMFMNALDVFVDGNQTVHRQAAYLVQSIVVVIFSIRNDKADTIT